jgi:hypothetical protein
MSEPVRLEPWVKGIQNIHDASRTPPANLLEAVNVNIDLDCIITPRQGYTFKAAGAHSLFEHNVHTYAVYQGLICELFPDEVKVLASFTIDSKVKWCILNGEPVFTNNAILGKITNGQAVLIGIDKPVVTDEVKHDMKSYAYSYVNSDGEEGPLSAVTSTPISTAPLGYKLKEYSTATAVLDGQVVSGDELFLQNETSIGGSPITFGCDKMPGGSYPAYWRGRLLVARGRTLFVSKPLHYGVYEEDAGVYPFEGKITFIASLDSGVYVGVKDVGVYFLRGNTPASWERVLVSNDNAQEGAALVISSARLKADGLGAVQLVAVWFTQFGFIVGLQSGGVLYPQSDHLSKLPLGNGSLYYNDGRLTVLY